MGLRACMGTQSIVVGYGVKWPYKIIGQGGHLNIISYFKGYNIMFYI